MRDRWLREYVVALSTLALAASVLFAFSRAPDGGTSQAPEPPGVSGGTFEVGRASDAEPSAGGPSRAAVFEARCQRCHSLEEAVALVEKVTAGEREAWLSQLLTRHFPPPEAERAPLVDYLLAETERDEP